MLEIFIKVMNVIKIIEKIFYYNFIFKELLLYF